MSDTTTTTQDVIDRQLALPPAVLEAISDDPEILMQLSRVQLAVVNDRMVKKLLATPDPSHAQYTAVSEQLRKTATLQSNANGTAGTGFSVNIVINPESTPAKVVSGESVIEHES